MGAQHYRAAATRSEREEAVTVNLPADLLPLWRVTRLQFKGAPAKRLDAFLAYAHDHGTEIEHAIDAEAEATLARDIRAIEASTESADDSFDLGANAEEATAPATATATAETAPAVQRKVCPLRAEYETALVGRSVRIMRLARRLGLSLRQVERDMDRTAAAAYEVAA